MCRQCNSMLTWYLSYQFPLSISIAGNIRVGNALGARDHEQAKLTAKLTMFCAGRYTFRHYFYTIY